MHTQPTAMQSVAEKEKKKKKSVIQVRNKLPGINFIFSPLDQGSSFKVI